MWEFPSLFLTGEPQLFLGIDQHARPLTVSLRNQEGDVLLAWQISPDQSNSHGTVDVAADEK